MSHQYFLRICYGISLLEHMFFDDASKNIEDGKGWMCDKLKTKYEFLICSYSNIDHEQFHSLSISENYKY